MEQKRGQKLTTNSLPMDIPGALESYISTPEELAEDQAGCSPDGQYQLTPEEQDFYGGGRLR